MKILDIYKIDIDKCVHVHCSRNVHVQCRRNVSVLHKSIYKLFHSVKYFLKRLLLCKTLKCDLIEF